MSNSTQNCTCIESGYAQTTNHCPVHKNSTQNDWENSHDFKQAVYAADILLDTPYADPDDDIRTVARQFNRMVERYNTLAKELADARREVIEEIDYNQKARKNKLIIEPSLQTHTLRTGESLCHDTSAIS